MITLEVFVPGKPEPQGSSRAFRHGNRVVITSANPKLKSWRAKMTEALREEAERRNISDYSGAAAMLVTFVLPRPASHLTSKGELTKSAPEAHLSKPDLDKLVRAVGDAISDAGIWRDDSVLMSLQAAKYYSDAFLEPGVTIVVDLLDIEAPLEP